ncbi:gliding motility-associated C-terminal domain-containing protein [Flagellimonas nanhaiensis]|uniref:Gliding motility-associated C-terminal domain-containing protein n=1 Tax=Flagellimonas nanhaiensis TaxID=2292706 RepID=A0A371JLZ3_9FLAO|nr:gliding motility-associated C-terminal domain-containing protein [Allomuricauda nanhaiensis]RDY58097.1 gliding motility-associated C-terminal domain-containing protein [Allomuricauda nanhaiensis]
MKNLLYILFLFSLIVQAQQGLYNGSGAIRIHNGGNIGFHTNLINDAAFDQNQGLAGFYGNNVLQVQGSIPPDFQDLEIMTTSNLFLQNSINVSSNVNFIDGNILTPKNDETIFLNFSDQGFFTGENDTSKVTGFAAIMDRSFFSFPVGDQDQLRPLMIDSEANSSLAICAYFFENPSNPSSILESFNINEKSREIGTVSNREFWVLQSSVPATVTISWNQRSALSLIPNATFESILVVGWSKSSNRWEVIGNTSQGGDLNQGFITSQTFTPSDYAAITFGTVPLPKDTFAVNNPTLGNYYISPNNDGLNDFLVIEGLSDSPNNSVLIYNRFGQKVFEKSNYVDEFTGVSNTGSLIMSQDIGLPEGVYYYLATLDDLELEYTGFLFLDR